MLIELTEPEVRLAATAGVDRRVGALMAQTHEVYGKASRGDYWTIDIEAVGAEIAVARALGVYWGPAATAAEDRLQGDLPGGIQVRHTQYKTGCLIAHDRDSDDHSFVLVVGTMPRLWVAGWIPGREAKQPRFWRENAPRPAYFVEQGELRPLEELRAR